MEDELSDWPDGETREITYTDWEKQADGTFVKVEKTVTLTKDEAEDLLDQLETSIDEADSRGSSEGSESPFKLEVGSILVGEAKVLDFTPDTTESTLNLELEENILSVETSFSEIPPDGVEILKEFTFDQEKFDSLKKQYNNYENAISTIESQINELNYLFDNWSGPEVQYHKINFVEKQSDGTYHTITKEIPLTRVSIPSYIAQLKAIKDQIGREKAPIREKLEAMVPGSTTKSEMELLHALKKRLDEIADNEAREQADAAKDL